MIVCFLEVLQRNGYDLQLSLKAEGLSINNSAVWLQNISDVSPQIYTAPQCLTSGGLLLLLGCFPTGMSDGQQNQE